MHSTPAASSIAYGRRPTSVIGGTMIIVGTSVGAGMFSMPTVSSGMWFSWSVVCLLITWFCMYHSSLLILETNLKYPVGASFNTFVKDVLGRRWNALNNLMVAFVLYVLTYAYISGGGSMVSLSAMALFDISLPEKFSGLIFAGVLSFVVWFSAALVSRLVSILIGGMLITFTLSMGDLSTTLKFTTLFNSVSTQISYSPYLLAAMPFFVATFGFHGNVSSLIKLYGKETVKLRQCLLYGSVISLVIYLIWLAVTLGNIPRVEFKSIIAAGGNVSVLVSALTDTVGGQTHVGRQAISGLLNFFANFAVISSFLGVSLGLFDFISDAFNFDDTAVGRLKTALVVFLPPTFGGVFFPNGFLYAIGYAGLAGAIWAIIIPVLVAKKSRARDSLPASKMWGGAMLLNFILSFGIVTVLFHLLGMFDLLPQYY